MLDVLFPGGVEVLLIPLAGIRHETLGAGLELIIGHDGVRDLLGLLRDLLAVSEHDAVVHLADPALAVHIDLDELRLQGEVGKGVVEGMVLGSEHGDGHPLRIGLHAQFLEHGDAVAGIAGHGEPVDLGLAAEEIKVRVFPEQVIIPAEAAAGQHHGLAVDLHHAAGIPGLHAADLPFVIQDQVLGRGAEQKLNVQILPFNGFEAGILHKGSAPAGTDGVIPAEQVVPLPEGHLRHACGKGGAHKVAVVGVLQIEGFLDVAVVAEPVEEIGNAVDGRTDQILFDDAAAPLVGHFDHVLAGVLKAQPLMPLGVGGHEAVGKIGVAAGLAALLIQRDRVVIDDRLRRALLVAGAGVTHLGAQAALETFLLIDLILGAHKVDGLSGTFAGAVVAAGTDPSVNYKHGIHPFHEFFTHLS